ncbi:MAG TPA: LysR family transcriptional regulator [Brevibacillus sp.]|nr:LysR family transcriptional regulator [Brevibacillus sp.]
MKLLDCKIRDLKIFVTVVEERNFTRAGEKLFIAQPSISKSIQRLEEELQVILFDRRMRDVALTDAGEIVYEHSKEVLALMKRMETGIEDLSDAAAGQLKIGLPQIIGTFIFPPIGKAYTERYPKVALKIEERGGILTEKLVEKGELDVGFVVFPVDNPLLYTEQIYEDSFVLCVSANHPLAAREQIELHEVKDEQFIVFAKTFALHKIVMNACERSGFKPHVLLESTQWDLVLELVSVQMGIAILPRVFANKLKNIEIASIPITNPSFKWQVGVITSKKYYHSAALKRFLDTVHEIYT